MTNLARFKIQSSPSTDRGYDVTIDGPLSLQLEASSSLIRTVEYAVYDAADPSSPLASLSAPALLLNNGAGSTGLRVAASAPTSIVALGLATGVFTGLTDASSWKVRCVVNGGIDSATNKPSPDLIFERIIAKRDSSGNRRLIPGEQTEYSARGWVDSIVPGPTGPSGPTGVGYAGLQSATSINASTVTPTASITTNLQATQTAFAVGDRVKLSSRSTPTDWCAGVIASFSGTAMAVTVDTNAGANVSHTDWSIAIAGDMPVPAPGAAGGTLQSNGTSWVRQLFLRTLGAIGLSGATGFLRGTDNEVLVSTNTGGADRAVLSTQTNGAGGGPILGDANLYSARMRASNNLYFEFGAGTVLLNTSGLSLGNYPITGLGSPSAAQDAATKGYVDTAITAIADAACVSTWDILHCHFDGANAGTSFPDASGTPLTATVVGAAVTSTVQQKFGTAAFVTDGNAGSYIYYTDTDGRFLTGLDDWCVECFYKPTGANTNVALVTGTDAANANFKGIRLWVNASGYVEVSTVDGTAGSYATTVTDTTTINARGTSWLHIAAVRKRGTLYLFVGGSSVGTPVWSPNAQRIAAGRLIVGSNPAATQSLVGYIDELRIQSMATYRAGFTPPAAALPDYSAIGAGYLGQVKSDGAGGLHTCRSGTTVWAPLVRPY